MQPCQEDNRSFFEKLQNAEGLDLRDNRGKRHTLAVVLVGVTAAVLSNRDGFLSSIHRHLVNHYEKLVEALGVEKTRPVSRSQLPIILGKVWVEVFDCLIFAQYGIKLNSKQRKWFAVDGKELRGSIESGEKRGEAIVRAVAHESGQSAAQDYYVGQKESEVPVVRGLLENSRLCAEKVSFDALHCKPKTVGVNSASGRRLFGWIERQSKRIEKAKQASY
jgi:hypothetical protein